MKERRLIWAIGIVVLLALNALIVQKERLLAGSESVYLELVPVDPRSLMQGDYMELGYEIHDDIAKRLNDSLSRRGRVIVTTDERGVVKLERLDDGELGPGERLLKWKRTDFRIIIGADAFYFQEGRAEHFERARFAEVKVDRAGNALLVGLRDESLEPL